MPQTIELTVGNRRSTQGGPNGGKASGRPTVLLVGNPNAGKTTLFNRLTGLRGKTANFAGTTLEHADAVCKFGQREALLVDLPGLYGLDAGSTEERLAREVLMGQRQELPQPDVVVVLLDATNLSRSLFLTGQVLEMGLPVVAAVNMSDMADRAGIELRPDELAKELNCPVVPITARTGKGIEELSATIGDLLRRCEEGEPATPRIPASLASCTSCGGCPFAARHDWAESIGGKCASAPHATAGRLTRKLDSVLAHPWLGIPGFFLVMAALFTLLFMIADIPMGLIDEGFGWLGSEVGPLLPAGDLRSLVVDGVIGGVGGVLVFLPQILILFFFLTLLEDTGYLSRAAFVMERLMRWVGLPGRAFVPMLSAHACAIPAIMAARIIESKRDRLATMLVIPLLTCSARLPVYGMVIALLFPDRWVMAGLLLTGAYALGIVASLFAAFLLKRTVLKGDTEPLVIELPAYRAPNLRNAIAETLTRARIFIAKAGTTILLLSIGLWAMSTYPKMPETAMPEQVAAQVTELESTGAPEDAERAEQLVAQQELAYSVAGRVGHLVEPIFRPLGFDWKINIGVVSSFAAREVIVSTLAIVYGASEDTMEDEAGIREVLQRQTHADGTPVFTTATSLSLLVFYVLAMQCLPTQVVTAREAGSWKWAILQLGYMTVMAYGAALVTYQAVSLFTTV